MIDITIKDPKIISVNEQYMHPVKKTKSGKYVSYVCKSPFLKEVQSFYQGVLSQMISDEEISSMKKTLDPDSVGLSLRIVIGLPRKDLYSYDISNLIKAVEDCIVARDCIDDTYHLDVSISKRVYLSEEDSWVMRIILEPVSLKYFE